MTEHFQGIDSEMQPRKALLKHGNKDFEQRIVASSMSSASYSSGFGNIWWSFLSEITLILNLHMEKQKYTIQKSRRENLIC